MPTGGWGRLNSSFTKFSSLQTLPESPAWGELFWEETDAWGNGTLDPAFNGPWSCLNGFKCNWNWVGWFWHQLVYSNEVSRRGLWVKLKKKKDKNKQPFYFLLEIKTVHTGQFPQGLFQSLRRCLTHEEKPGALDIGDKYELDSKWMADPSSHMWSWTWYGLLLSCLEDGCQSRKPGHSGVNF